MDARVDPEGLRRVRVERELHLKADPWMQEAGVLFTRAGEQYPAYCVTQGSMQVDDTWLEHMEQKLQGMEEPKKYPNVQHRWGGYFFRAQLHFYGPPRHEEGGGKTTSIGRRG